MGPLEPLEAREARYNGYKISLRVRAEKLFFGLRELAGSCRWYPGLDLHWGIMFLRCLRELMRGGNT